MRDAEIRLGSVLGPGYGLERIIDDTGAGAVYEAVHEERPQERFAVKVYDPKLASGPEIVQGLRREVDLAALLGGPHVVRVFDVGEDEDGAPYIVLEMLEGEDLSRRVHRVGRLGAVQAASIVNQLARTLEAAHAAGIVHGDLRPSRVFLTNNEGSDDFVKIMGFGAPRIRVPGSASPHAIAYLAPEQVTGDAVDRRADVWAVGAMLYEALTGTSPFLGPTAPATIHKITEVDPPPPSMLAHEVPEAVESVLRRALAKAPEDRHGTIAFLRDEFMRALGLEVPQTGKPPPLPGTPGTKPPPLPGRAVPPPAPPPVPAAAAPVTTSTDTLEALGELGLQPASAPEPAQPAQPAEAVQPAQPAEAVQPIDEAQAVAPADAGQAVDTADEAEPAESIGELEEIADADIQATEEVEAASEPAAPQLEPAPEARAEPVSPPVAEEAPPAEPEAPAPVHVSVVTPPVDSAPVTDLREPVLGSQLSPAREEAAPEAEPARAPEAPQQVEQAATAGEPAPAEAEPASQEIDFSDVLPPEPLSPIEEEALAPVAEPVPATVAAEEEQAAATPEPEAAPAPAEPEAAPAPAEPEAAPAPAEPEAEPVVAEAASTPAPAPASPEPVPAPAAEAKPEPVAAPAPVTPKPEPATPEKPLEQPPIVAKAQPPPAGPRKVFYPVPVGEPSAAPSARDAALPSTDGAVRALRQREASSPRPLGVAVVVGAVTIAAAVLFFIWQREKPGTPPPGTTASQPTEPAGARGSPEDTAPKAAEPLQEPTPAPAARKTPSEGAPEPMAAEPPEPPPADTIKVRLLIQPATARVVLDGIATKDNPIVLPRADRTHSLSISAPGYQTEKREFRALIDGEVAVTLEPQRAQKTRTSTPKTPPKKRPAPKKDTEEILETQW